MMVTREAWTGSSRMFLLDSNHDVGGLELDSDDVEVLEIMLQG